MPSPKLHPLLDPADLQKARASLLSRSIDPRVRTFSQYRLADRQVMPRIGTTMGFNTQHRRWQIFSL
jgi:hypothetical protein